MRALLRTAAGHLWTMWPSVKEAIAPTPVATSEPWSMTMQTDRGPVQLRGLWRDEGGDVAAVVVHGLGGTSDRPYCRRAARAVHHAGWSCLRLELRGAGGAGQDFYHAGLTEDLDAALRSETLARFSHLVVIGYSLGGHLTLRYACGRPVDRLRAVAAVSAPLDLARGADHLDSRSATIYRRHILRRLREDYSAVAATATVPTPVPRVRRVDSIREWDSLTVVPRHGFDDADDYYSSVSVGPRLAQLGVPALLVAGLEDPMIRARDVRTALDGASARLEVAWVHGGHVSFDPRADLGRHAPLGVENQVVDWLREKTGTSR